MKKTLVSALTTALVVGAASTTFAAANPFSDVPTDHWAYDAVNQLAKDGVVEGYGDGTYQGDKEITRYEMAQIVAKAMTKEDISKADKALVDKLAAEFSDELNNLGVRVSNLEKKTDNVKWTGEARYTYSSTRSDAGVNANGDTKANNNELLFRLTPTATINDHWAAKARIDYYVDMNSSKNTVGGTDSNSNGDAYLDQAYVTGTYGNTQIDLGKFPVYTEQGLILDQNLSGGQVTFHTGKLTSALTAGRYNFNNKSDWDFNDLASAGSSYKTGSYQGVNFTYKANKAFSFAAGYSHLNDRDLSTQAFGGTAYGANAANIWDIGMTYNFNDSLRLSGAYAKNNEGDVDGKFKKAYNVELAYKTATPENAGSFGLYAAYRYLGNTAVLHPTFDGASIGQKGWEFGAQYTFTKNVMGTLRYFTGKDIATDKDASKLFGRVEFFF